MVLVQLFIFKYSSSCVHPVYNLSLNKIWVWTLNVTGRDGDDNRADLWEMLSIIFDFLLQHNGEFYKTGLIFLPQWRICLHLPPLHLTSLQSGMWMMLNYLSVKWSKSCNSSGNLKSVIDCWPECQVPYSVFPLEEHLACLPVCLCHDL